MPVVFTAFAALFAVAGWLLPHTVHRLGYRMALFFLAMAGIAALIGAIRGPAARADD